MLVEELPALIAALPDRYGRVVRVSYSMVFWDAAPRRLVVEGRMLRLGGFRSIDPAALSLRTAQGADPVDLLVLAPETGAAQAARVLDAITGGQLPVGGPAGATGAVTTAPVAPAAGRPRAQPTAAERVWEDEGGSALP